MIDTALQEMTGEGLLLLAIRRGEAVAGPIATELDRRAFLGRPEPDAQRAQVVTIAAGRRVAGAVTAA